MNPFASTLLQQANEAIEVGATAQAMDLLRQAKLLAGADRSLANQILARMISIAPACACEAEAAIWRRQLAQAESGTNSSTADLSHRPKSASQARASLHWVWRIVGLIGALAIGALALQLLWRFSAARFNVDSTLHATTSRSSTQPT